MLLDFFLYFLAVVPWILPSCIDFTGIEAGDKTPIFQEASH